MPFFSIIQGKLPVPGALERAPGVAVGARQTVLDELDVALHQSHGARRAVFDVDATLSDAPGQGPRPLAFATPPFFSCN